MPSITAERTKWHECVIDLLGRSDAIADRDDDGRAIYYLYGWSGTVQFIDDRGHLSEIEASLGSVRMDGFSLFTKADLNAERVVVAEIVSDDSSRHCVFARIMSTEKAARQGRAFDCLIIDQPDSVDDRTVRARITQTAN